MPLETPPKVVLQQSGEGRMVSGLDVEMMYKIVGADTNEQFLALEYTAPPKLCAQPHWHKVTTHIFYVITGTLSLRVARRTIHLGPGGYAFVPPRTVHTFYNQTTTPAKFMLLCSPAILENYYLQLAELAKKDQKWPPKDANQVAALQAQYDIFLPPVRA